MNDTKSEINACSMQNVRLSFSPTPILDVFGVDAKQLVECLGVWSPPGHSKAKFDQLPILGGTTVRLRPEVSSTHNVSMIGPSLIYNLDTHCHINAAARHLSRLPMDVRMLETKIQHVLIGRARSTNKFTPHTEEDFCHPVLDLFSLSFQDTKFQLPTFHSFQRIRKMHAIHFEELMMMPQLHTFGNARGFVESEELQELACRKCDIHTFGATAQMKQSSTEDVGRPKLLFYEYAENRRVLNAPELCAPQ